LTARLNGKQVGRKKGTGFETKKSKAAKEKIRVHCKAFGGTLDDMECMKLTGLARNTYYKYKRQIRADLTDEGKLKKEELLLCLLQGYRRNNNPQKKRLGDGILSLKQEQKPAEPAKPENGKKDHSFLITLAVSIAIILILWLIKKF